MNESALLRALADNIDELDALKQFPADITDPGTVTVAWTASSDHPGYEALSQAISAMVEQHWNALRSQVVKKKESEVQSARKEWIEMTAPAAETAVAGSDAAAGTPLGSRMQLLQRQA